MLPLLLRRFEPKTNFLHSLLFLYSVREPTQVFILLESVYGAFDKIAKRRNIFKVETIGDCYVAVTGLVSLRFPVIDSMSSC
jgi:Adenylate and Guanylate cyclase catalytic domain